MDFIGETILNFFLVFIRDILEKSGLFIASIYAYAVEINQLPQVSAVCVFTTLLGASLCGLVVCKNIIGTYGFGTEGDPDQDPTEIIFRLCKTLGIMGANTLLFNEMLKFSTLIGRDITMMLSPPRDFNLSQILAVEQASPTVLLCGGAIAGGCVLFTITACIRGAEIILNRVLLPIFCIDCLSSNPEKWRMFIFQYGISFFSFIIQMFCYNIFIILYLNFDLTDIKNYAVLIAWLLLSIRTPKMLEKYIYATGIGQAVSHGASRVGQVVMMAGMRM